MWGLVLLLAGCGLVECAMALVDTQSDVKYVCASSSTDSVVQMFFVIDCIRVGKGALVTAVAGWGNTRRCERDFLKSDVYRNSVGAVLMVCLFVFLLRAIYKGHVLAPSDIREKSRTSSI